MIVKNFQKNRRILLHQPNTLVLKFNELGVQFLSTYFSDVFYHAFLLIFNLKISPDGLTLVIDFNLSIVIEN